LDYFDFGAGFQDFQDLVIPWFQFNPDKILDYLESPNPVNP
jgi:hypothetical protein